ncbi:MAG: hypothetical protein ACLU4J_26195 [Butyricimonas paravirosa]
MLRTAMYGLRVLMEYFDNDEKGEAGNVYTSVRYEAIASMPRGKLMLWTRKLTCECTIKRY